MGLRIGLGFWRLPKTAGENEVCRSAQAEGRPEVVPGQLLVQEEQCEGYEHNEGDNFLQEFQLEKVDASSIADAAGRATGIKIPPVIPRRFSKRGRNHDLDAFRLRPRRAASE